jgi:hypothetical protein
MASRHRSTHPGGHRVAGLSEATCLQIVAVSGARCRMSSKTCPRKCGQGRPGQRRTPASAVGTRASPIGFAVPPRMRSSSAAGPRVPASCLGTAWTLRPSLASPPSQSRISPATAISEHSLQPHASRCEKRPKRLCPSRRETAQRPAGSPHCADRGGGGRGPVSLCRALDVAQRRRSARTGMVRMPAVLSA